MSNCFFRKRMKLKPKRKSYRLLHNMLRPWIGYIPTPNSMADTATMDTNSQCKELRFIMIHNALTQQIDQMISPGKIIVIQKCSERELNITSKRYQLIIINPLFLIDVNHLDEARIEGNRIIFVTRMTLMSIFVRRISMFQIF